MNENYTLQLTGNISKFYRIIIEETTGEKTISKVLSAPKNLSTNQLLKIYPNPFANGTLNIELPENSYENILVQIVNAAGAKSFEHNIKADGKRIQISPQLSAGVYFVKIILKDKTYSGKILVK